MEKFTPTDSTDYEFWLSDDPMAQEPLQEIVSAEEEFSLLDLLDKLLTKGVILSGDLTLSVAGVDLLYVGLRLMISTADKAVEVGAVRLKDGRIV